MATATRGRWGRRRRRSADGARTAPGLCALALVLWCASGCASAGSLEGRDTAAPTPEQLFQRGIELAHSGKLVQAEQFLVASMENGAPRVRVLPVLLRVCVEAGRPRRALEHVRAALQASPEDVQLWTLAGALAWGLSQPQRAHDYLRHAEALPDAPADVAYWLGRVALQRGDPDRAEQHMRRYLALEPRGRFAERARFWLRMESRHSPPAQDPGAEASPEGGAT